MIYIICLVFIYLNQVFCQESPVPGAENSPSPISINNDTNLSYYDYTLNFTFELNEVQVPSYVVGLIYNESTPNTITTDDVINLYKVKSLSLNETQTVLNKMNISSEKILSIEGCDIFLTELDVNFKDIYDKVTTKLSISGVPLRQFLIDLGINADAFSSALAFGSGDPYEEFRKGNFSKESVEAALTKVNKTLAELFAAIRDEFLSWANLKQRTEIVQKLNKYNFGARSAVDLWSVINLTVADARQIPNFNNIITNATAKWNTTVLGILTGPYEAIVNLVGYEIWKDDPLVKVSAESFSSKSKVQVRWVISQTDVPNIVKLSCANMNISSESISYAVIGLASELTLNNCTFVTLANESLISEVILESHNHENEIHVMNFTSLRSEVVIGSPLICNNSVFGLAKSVDNDTIIFDTFHVDHSGHGGSPSLNSLLYPLVLAVLIGYIFWTQ